MHPYVHRSIIHGGQDMETTKLSLDRGLDKEDVVHVYYGILLSHKKRWNTPLCNNMNGPWEYHAKRNARWKKSRTLGFPSCVEYKSETHRHRQQYGGYQKEGSSRGMVKVKGHKYMVMEEDLTLGGGHTMQYTDHILNKCTLDTYMILLTNVTTINLILKSR